MKEYKTEVGLVMHEMKGVIHLCNVIQSEKESLGDEDSEMWFLIHQIVQGWLCILEESISEEKI